MSRPHPVRLILALAAAALLLVPAAASARFRPDLVMYEDGCEMSCMGMGPGHMQMPMKDLMSPTARVSDATKAQKRRARRFLHRVRRDTRRRLPSLRAARRHGYVRGFRMATMSGDRKAPFFHYDNHHLYSDRHTLDPRRPESLIYWFGPAGPKLVGVMFRASSRHAVHDPIGGPFLRWHAHAECDHHRNPSDPMQFTAPEGSYCATTGLAHYGATQMVHVWLTRHLATAYAHAVPAKALHIIP